ncbi:hypothetical protein P3T76_011005 [Phytophthora citrophthora]|uniref:Uncharacterized protein n=1 Tax=Phytophthora citrophthora TaxID=4793 RepID=A0AAD9G9P1_9STRA|nr:hypothetical protein P3T76_011005 [Phytophthora citrophthora]
MEQHRVCEETDELGMLKSHAFLLQADLEMEHEVNREAVSDPDELGMLIRKSHAFLLQADLEMV